MSAPTCRGCGAVIRWIKMQSGKNMPVDPEKNIEWLTLDSSSGLIRVSVVTDDGDMISGWPASVIVPGAFSVEGYRPHWGTCPKAKAFRR